MMGVYVLILRLDKETEIIVGRLGSLNFKKGFYAYIGSAQGTGGFKRVTRHFRTACGINTVRKWHIDYLLPQVEIICAVLLPTNQRLECTVAKALDYLTGISGFGCTDCACSTHLRFAEVDLKDSVINTCNELMTPTYKK